MISKIAELAMFWVRYRCFNGPRIPIWPVSARLKFWARVILILRLHDKN